LRIAYIPTFADAPVDPQIARSVAVTAEIFAAQGHRVVRLDNFVLAEPIGKIWPILSETGVAWLMDQHPGRDGEISDAIAAMAQRGRAHTARDYLPCFRPSLPWNRNSTRCSHASMAAAADNRRTAWRSASRIPR